MFNGIVEEKGRIASIEPSHEIITFIIETQKVYKDIEVNDSLAVDGICLTVVAKQSNLLTFNVVPQTLRKSTLGKKGVGDFVNLERSLGVNDRIDGHLVQGHVDCTGRIIAIKDLGESKEMEFEIPEKYKTFIIQRGSIAIDGISLTVAEYNGNRFMVAFIPHTLELTTMDDHKTGDLVNIEFDMIGKYVLNTLENWKGVIT